MVKETKSTMKQGTVRENLQKHKTSNNRFSFESQSQVTKEFGLYLKLDFISLKYV